MKDLSIIIVSYNTKKLLKDCVASLTKHTKAIEYEVIVVDNASTDGSVDVISKIQAQSSNFHLIKNYKNYGFGKANNQGIKKAKGRYILLLNSDTLIKDNVLGKMVSWMDKNKKVGIATCALKNKDGSEQGTGGYFPNLLRVFSWMTIQDFPFVDKIIKPFHPMKEKSFSRGVSFYKKEKELDWVTGAFLLMREKVIADVGYFDENYFMYTEEVDYCFRAKSMGWKVWYLPQWSITHIGGASGKSWSFVTPEYRGMKLFYKKHYPKWQYPILRFFLKIGALGRIILYGIMKGKEVAKVYVKAFAEA